MTDSNHEQANPKQKELGRLRDGSFRGLEDDEFDRALDRALAKYAVVDPRPGLEERVLAHLRTAPEPSSWMAGRLWAVAGFAIVSIVIAAGVMMAWRAGGHPPLNTTKHLPAPHQLQPQPEIRVAANPQSETQSSKPAPKIAVRRVPAKVEIATAPQLPRLDQFPSPEPLNDQEKLLVDYIEQNPQRAVFIAEAQMNELRQEAEEHRRLAAEDSQQ